MTYSYLSHLVNWTRIKSLLWHTGAIVAGYLLSDLATAISSHQLVVPSWVAILMGLLIAQATKALANYNDQASPDQPIEQAAAAEDAVQQVQ